MSTPTASPKVIAIAQEHRGHGQSTAAYFLARALGAQQLPILLADLTNRPMRLQELDHHFHAPRVVRWAAPAPWLRDIPTLLGRLRQDVQGKARCILIDTDMALIEQILESTANQGIDYVLIATEPTAEGQKSAERAADRWKRLRDRQRIGVIFARINPQEIDDLPAETEGGLPLLGYWPADYRLAISDDYSSSGAGLTEPHQAYLAAINRLALRIVRIAGLR